MVATEGNTLSDSMHNLLAKHLGADVGHIPVGFHRTHSAPDIHAHGIGNDLAGASQNAAYRHPLTGMHVGHDGQMMEQKRKARQMFNLAHCRILDKIGPYLNRAVVDNCYIHLFSVVF